MQNYIRLKTRLHHSSFKAQIRICLCVQVKQRDDKLMYWKETIAMPVKIWLI